MSAIYNVNHFLEYIFLLQLFLVVFLLRKKLTYVVTRDV